MIKLDRCGWCKHCIEVKNGVTFCNAFPEGQPESFEFDVNKKCTDKIFFEVKEEEREDYNEIFGL